MISNLLTEFTTLLNNCQTILISQTQTHITTMKIFDLLEIPAKMRAYLIIEKQAVDLIIEICRVLEISVPAMHASLWVFHCNAVIMGYHNFDRFLYACGAILVGSKLMECLRYPVRILEECRKILRRRKNLEHDVDSEEYLKKQVKRVFDAEVNIMINIGFDFDIKLGIQEADKLGIFSKFRADNSDSLSTKLRQTLTSLYETQIVVLFSAETIALVALKLLLKAQKRSVDAMEFQKDIKDKLMSEEVKQAEKEYFQRCPYS